MELDKSESMKEDYDDDAIVKGWPFGLLPMTAKLAEANATSCMTLPSGTSSSESASSSASSSDFDAESMGSFFPENSTSLGTLIGIESSSQLLFMQDQFEESYARERRDGRGKLQALLGCGGKIHEDPTEEVNELEGSMEASPSLSRCWSMDRRDITQSASNSIRTDATPQKRQMDKSIEAYEDHGNLRRHKSWMRSHSCGPSLHNVALQQPGPVSPWRAFFHRSLRSVPISNKGSRHRSIRRSSKGSRTASGGSRLCSFWLALCAKLSSSLATWSL